MESVIKLVADCIVATVKNVTEEQSAQLDLAYAKANAIYKNDREGIKSLFDLNDEEVDEMLAHSKRIKDRFAAILGEEKDELITNLGKTKLIGVK